MCMSTLAAIHTKGPSAKLREQISLRDPASRALGYEGLADPFGDFWHRQAGTKSKLTQKAEATGARNAEAHRDAAYRAKVYEEPSAHVRTIAGRS